MRGKTVETEEIPAYCAVALAGLGWLPDTLMSRSIVIRMRRRAPTENHRAVSPPRRDRRRARAAGPAGGLGRREGQDPVRRATGNAGRNRGSQRRRLGGAVRHRGRGGSPIYGAKMLLITSLTSETTATAAETRRQPRRDMFPMAFPMEAISETEKALSDQRMFPMFPMFPI